MPGAKPKVLLAMSGGVDSSAAAALLLREGYDVVGVFMRLGSPGESFDELIQDAPQAASERSAGAGCDPRQARKIKIGHQGLLLDQRRRRCPHGRREAGHPVLRGQL